MKEKKSVKSVKWDLKKFVWSVKEYLGVGDVNQAVNAVGAPNNFAASVHDRNTLYAVLIVTN